MILIKKIVDGKEVFESISKEDAMKLEDKKDLLFTSEDEEEDFYDELEDLNDELEDLNDELEDLKEELDDIDEDEDINGEKIKESIRNISNKAQDISKRIGKSVNDAMKDLGNCMKNIGKSISSYKDVTFKGNSKANKLLSVLPFLDSEDIHELVQDLLNGEESLKDINVVSFLPFLSSNDCDALFIRSLEDGNNKYKPEDIAPFVSKECLSTVVDKYLNGEIKDFKVERLYPYLSSSDIKKVFKKILAEKE